MRRPASVLALLALLSPLALVAQGSNQQESPPIKLTGQLRMRSELDARGVVDTNNSIMLHLLRTRLKATARPLPWLTVVAELQDSRHFGSGNPAQGRGTQDVSADALDMRQAFGQIDSVFGTPINVRVGRQEIGYNNDRLLGVSNWSNTGRSFDAARLSLVVPTFTLDAFASRLSAPSATPVVAQNFYGLWGSYRPESTLQFDLFDLVDENTTPIRQGEDTGKAILFRNTVGTYIKGSAGILDWEIEGASQMGNQAASDSAQQRQINAFFASAGFGITLIPESKTKLILLGTLLSGDGSASDSTLESFNTLFGTNHRLYGTIDIVPELAGNFGLVDLSAQISMQPSAPLRLLLEGHLHRPQRGGGDDIFGTEIDFTFWYRIASPFEISGGVSTFLPGKLLEQRLGGNEPKVWAYVAGQWDF